MGQSGGARIQAPRGQFMSNEYRDWGGGGGRRWNPFAAYDAPPSFLKIDWRARAEKAEARVKELEAKNQQLKTRAHPEIARQLLEKQGRILYLESELKEVRIAAKGFEGENLAEHVSCWVGDCTKLEHQLIDLRHRHQTLEDETKWCEGEMAFGGAKWEFRWRGTLFVGPEQTCPLPPVTTQIEEGES